MCFNTALNVTPTMLAKRYRKNDSLITDFKPTFHISGFAHNYNPIVTQLPEMQSAQWGLIPYWIKTQQEAETIRNHTLNARAESIFTKPSFRGPILHQRCLIPVTGFFDWQHEGEQKIPYFISLRNEPIFSLAGIYDFWRNPVTGDTITTYSVITTEANELMAEIHNTNFRMPVIISSQAESDWLDSKLPNEEIKHLMLPFPEEEMQAYKIKKDFLKKSPFDSSILSPS